MISENIELIPADQQVAESLGCQPGIFGALFILFACFFPAVENRTPGSIELIILIAIGLAGLGLAYYEFWRRRNRTVLVRDGENIAVFRRGRFALTVEAGQIKIYNMPLLTFIKIFAAQTLFAFGFFFFAVILKDLEPGYRLLNALAGLALIASMASLIRTRFFCDALQLPGEKGRFMLETVLVRPFQKHKLFS